VLAVGDPDLRFGRLGRLDGRPAGDWFGAALVWTMVWAMNLLRGGRSRRS